MDTNTTPEPVTGATTDTNPIISVLEKRLTGQAESVSSAQGNVESLINTAITGLQKSQEAGAARITTDYRQQKEDILGQGQRDVTDFSESRSGFGTQLAALRNLVGDTDKSIRDLETRKQDALMANDAATASAIAEMQLKKAEFVMEKEQTFYNNLFQMAGIEVQQSAQKQAATQFKEKLDFDVAQRTIDRQDRMAGLAAEYGVEMAVGDTYESLLGKISAVVKADKAAEAAYKAASLAQKDKEEQALGVYDNLIYDSISSGGTAQGAANAVLTHLQKTGETLSRAEFNEVYTKAQEMEAQFKRENAQAEAEQGGGFLGRFFGGSTSSKYATFGGDSIFNQGQAQTINKRTEGKENIQNVLSDESVIESPEGYLSRRFGI